MNKVLVDTNILIYSLDDKSAFHQQALSILRNKNNVIYISTKNISDFFAVSTKLKYEQKVVLDFYEDVKASTITLYPDRSSLNLFETLIARYQPKGNQVFDMEIVSIMLANGIDKIATFNTKDFIGIGEIELLEIT